jgi:hypothetical protein
MINLSKFVHTENGKYLMSILLGFGFASLFRVVCKGKNCIIFQAPPLEELTDKIYKVDNKCYKYVTNATKCDLNKKIIEFA